MKARDSVTGTFKDVYVKALDSLPVGSEIDFDGATTDIPAGWEEVDDKMKILGFQETWLNLYNVYGAGIFTLIPIYNPNNTEPTADLSLIQIYYDGYWYNATVSAKSWNKTWIRLGISVPTGVNLTEGQAYLIRITGTITTD